MWHKGQQACESSLASVQHMGGGKGKRLLEIPASALAFLEVPCPSGLHGTGESPTLPRVRGWKASSRGAGRLNRSGHMWRGTTWAKSLTRAFVAGVCLVGMAHPS